MRSITPTSQTFEFDIRLAASKSCNRMENLTHEEPLQLYLG